MDFGTLTHSALESLSELGNETPDEEEIYQCMVARLEKEFSYRFGRSPSLSILQQKASIERRLRRVAQLHRQDLVERLASGQGGRKISFGYLWFIGSGRMEGSRETRMNRLRERTVFGLSVWLTGLIFIPNGGYIDCLTIKLQKRGPRNYM